MPLILRHKRTHRYRLIQRRHSVIPIPMLEKMIRECLVITRLPIQMSVTLHGQFRRDANGGTKWVFKPIIFREVDAVPTPRKILVPDRGADDADGTFVDKCGELYALSQNVNVRFFVHSRHELRLDVFFEDNFPAFSGPFWVCSFRVLSSDNFLRLINDALSAEDVWDEEVARDVPLRVISERVVSSACHVRRREIQVGFCRSTGKRRRLVQCIDPGFGWTRDGVSVTFDIKSVRW